MPSLIGSKPNQVPVNADLGTMAFQDAANIAGDVGVGGNMGVGGDTTGVVAGVSVTSKFCVKSEGGNPVAGFVHVNNATASSGSGTFACRSRGTTASPVVVQNNDSLWNMFVAGYDGTDLALAAQISVEVDGTPGSNDMPGRFIVSTTPDGSQAPVERMRIDSAGNLIQQVNTTAATLSTNNTLTFSIVDNSTLRVSVRGSDGVTRTGTVALT